MFESMPGLQVAVEPHPRAFEGNLLKRVDVLVLYDMMTTSTPAQRDRLRTFAEAGKGIVILHHAICGYVDWPWWYENVAGGRYLPTSTFQHDVTIPVRIVADHPVTAGLKDFQIFDETYKGMWFAKNLDLLITTKHEKGDGPIAWLGPSKTNRVVVLQGGHDKQAHLNPNWQRLVKNAILWAAMPPPGAASTTPR
jgi:type 1 glutamine amidotransferase